MGAFLGMEECTKVVKCPDCKGRKFGCRRCEYRGSIRIFKRYGVFVWNREARYPVEDAIKVYTSEARCDAYIAAHPGQGYVTRSYCP